MRDEELRGVYPAFVCDIKDPEKRGRIRVNCVDVYGDESVKSEWCEPCVPFASDDSGDFSVPEKEDGVWITFIDGDIDQPVYLGGWWSKNATPLGTDYDKVDEQRIIVLGETEITLKSDSCVIKNGKATITLEENKIKIKGNVEIEGNLKVDKITTDSMTSNGVSFNSHTHTGVHGETSGPH